MLCITLNRWPQIMRCLYCTWSRDRWKSIRCGTGPSCSKLTMSLVNLSLKLWSLNMAYVLTFLLKKCESYSHFLSKNTWELDIVLTRTVNILTTNRLFKLTLLWTTGPMIVKSHFLSNYRRRNLKKCTFGHERPAKMQISLCIPTPCSESSLERGRGEHFG